ncbi:NDP-sugar synthase [Planctomycetota bacterium]
MQPTLASVDVVILCGGLGTRLQGVAPNCPKPLVQISERPFLDLLIEQFRRFGFRRFILCTGHRGEMIRDYFIHLRESVDIVISHETYPMGTAGAVKNAESLIQSDPFIVTNGDSLCSMDLAAFYDFHESKRARLSMVLARSEDPEDYGSVHLNENGQISAFEEKQAYAKRGYISAGIYLFQKKVLDYIPADVRSSLEFDIFPRLVTLKGDCYGYDSQRPVIDIGTPQRLKKARQHLTQTLA